MSKRKPHPCRYCDKYQAEYRFNNCHGEPGSFPEHCSLLRKEFFERNPEDCDYYNELAGVG